MEATYWIVCVLTAVAAVQGTRCPDLQPPLNGVLKCQTVSTSLQCTATCLEGQVFESGQRVVHRTCLSDATTWLQGPPYLPRCVPLCNSSLIDQTDNQLRASSTLTPVTPGQDFGPDASRLTAPGIWRPATDDILQFIQVDLGGPHVIRAWRVRGDGVDSYVRLFRLLFSQDGLSWTTYTDGRVMDKFLTGSFDSGTEVTEVLDRPQVARYVRVNPLSWHTHIALDWDLVGCPYHTETIEPPVVEENRCKLPQPPDAGAVNCERNGTHVVCTAYCLNNRVFPDLGPALDLTCDPEVGLFTHTPLPPCVERDTTVPPVNISGPCMQEEEDCFQMTNGDYQYCGDCHYFSTCSHDYFFVRPCPEHLQFDSRQGLCDYHSDTCNNSKRHALYKAARRAHTSSSYWGKH